MKSILTIFIFVCSMTVFSAQRCVEYQSFMSNTKVSKFSGDAKAYYECTQGGCSCTKYENYFGQEDLDALVSAHVEQVKQKAITLILQNAEKIVFDETGHRKSEEEIRKSLDKEVKAFLEKAKEADL